MLSVVARFIPEFNGAMLSVVNDVSVDSEAPMVTSSILRFTSPTRFFEGAHKSRMCIHMFIGLSVCSYHEHTSASITRS